MSNLDSIICSYEKANVDKYFNPAQKPDKIYPFRVLNASEMIYGLEVWVDVDVFGEDGKPVLDENGAQKKGRRPKRFTPENRKAAMSWLAKADDKLSEFLAMHIYSTHDKDCFIFSPKQVSIIKPLIEVARLVGEKHLHEVTFLLGKKGSGKEVRYTLSTTLDDDANVKLSPLPEEALAKAAENPVNMLALMFGDRPWNNDTKYDVRFLDQSPNPAVPAVATAASLPAKVKGVKVHA